jgi:hypothetical protein
MCRAVTIALISIRGKRKNTTKRDVYASLSGRSRHIIAYRTRQVLRLGESLWQDEKLQTILTPTINYGTSVDSRSTSN